MHCPSTNFGRSAKELRLTLRQDWLLKGTRLSLDWNSSIVVVTAKSGHRRNAGHTQKFFQNSGIPITHQKPGLVEANSRAGWLRSWELASGSTTFELNGRLRKPVSASLFWLQLPELFRGALSVRPFALRGLGIAGLASLKETAFVSVAQAR
jgi:hypothetical protein